MKFSTNNSTYIVDTQNKTIVGGFLKNPVKFSTLKAIIGEPAIVLLDEGMYKGRILRTSPVVSY